MKKEKKEVKEKNKQNKEEKNKRLFLKKSDLIIKFSEKNNITVKDAERVLEIIINEITTALTKGNRAEFRGLESLTLRSD